MNRRVGKGGSQWQRFPVPVRSLLVGNVGSGIPHEYKRDRCAGQGDRERSRPHDGARGHGPSNYPGRKRGCCDAEIAGRLVQSECEAPPRRPGKVDLHDDRHRPGQPLVRAEEDVRCNDHPPAGSECQHGRDREREQPAENEQALPPDAVGERACTQVRERFGYAEGDDKGEHGCM